MDSSSHYYGDDAEAAADAAYMRELEEENLRDLLARNRPAAYKHYGQKQRERGASSIASGTTGTAATAHIPQSYLSTLQHAGTSRFAVGVNGITMTALSPLGSPTQPQALAGGGGGIGGVRQTSSPSFAPGRHQFLSSSSPHGGTASGGGAGGSYGYFAAAPSTTGGSGAVVTPSPQSGTSALPPNRLTSVAAKLRERDQLRDREQSTARGEEGRGPSREGGRWAPMDTVGGHNTEAGFASASTSPQPLHPSQSHSLSEPPPHCHTTRRQSAMAVDAHDSHRQHDDGSAAAAQYGGPSPPVCVEGAVPGYTVESSPRSPNGGTAKTKRGGACPIASTAATPPPPPTASTTREEETFAPLTAENVRSLSSGTAGGNAVVGGSFAYRRGDRTNGSDRDGDDDDEGRRSPSRPRGTTFSTILQEFVNESLSTATSRVAAAAAAEYPYPHAHISSSSHSPFSPPTDGDGVAADGGGGLRRRASGALLGIMGMGNGGGAAAAGGSGNMRNLPIHHMRSDSLPHHANSPPLGSTPRSRAVSGGGGTLRSVDSMMVAAAAGSMRPSSGSQQQPPLGREGSASRERAASQLRSGSQQHHSSTYSSPAGGGGDGSGGSRAVTPRSSQARAWINFPRSRVRAYFGDTPWESLHAQPTLVVGFLATAFIMVCTYIMQQYVLEIKDHLGLFAIGSYVNFSSYYVVYFYLEKYSTSFRKISQDKKFYTISNIIKASMLAAITPFAVKHLCLIVIYDSWDTSTLRNLGCVYSIPDFVSLLVVRRMSNTTVFHHVCVVVFNYFSLQNDYGKENVCRCIVVYAAFSTFAYVVNMLLASRFLGVTGRVNKFLALIALAVYVFCCAVNWTWQVHYLRKLILGHDHWSIYVYMILICFVMWDDIVLNRWLLQNFRNTTGFLVSSSSAGTIIARNSSRARLSGDGQLQQQQRQQSGTASGGLNLPTGGGGGSLPRAGSGVVLPSGSSLSNRRLAPPLSGSENPLSGGGTAFPQMQTISSSTSLASGR